MKGEKTHPTELSARHLEVCKLLVDGQSTNAAIAAKLGIAVNTVKQHMKAILAITGMSTRLELALWISRHPEILKK